MAYLVRGTPVERKTPRATPGDIRDMGSLTGRVLALVLVSGLACAILAAAGSRVVLGQASPAVLVQARAPAQHENGEYSQSAQVIVRAAREPTLHKMFGGYHN